MDRQIVYPGQIPLETDLLNTNKNVMVALGKMAAAMFGSSTFVNGMSVGPNSPAALNVIVQPGEIYSLANIDGTAYSSLAADTTHSIIKQGIMLDAVTLSTPAPGTAGQSINYLIQAQFSEVDGNAVVLPYYNASNPSQAYSGPNGAGTTNNTARKGTVVVSAKAGVAATTGSQTTPAPDAGYVGLYVVTVANGQSTVTAANISQYVSAPIMPVGLVAAAQTGLSGYAVDIGSANTYQVAYSPAITALTDGMVLKFKAKTANSGASTFNPNGLGASPIWNFNHVALQGGEIVANGDIWVQWNSSLNGGSGAWVLIDATGGNQLAGRLLNVQVFANSGTYTPTPGTTSVVVEVQGGGGGGGGSAATGAGQLAAGAGGNSGSYAKARITSGFSGVAVTVGAAGTGGTAGAGGGTGGTSSFGALVSAPGGAGGTGGAAVAPPAMTPPPTNSAIASGGNISNASSTTGAVGLLMSTSYGLSGAGAGSAFGAGPSGTNSPSGGGVASNYGCGGGGALTGSSGGGNSGGVGAKGVVIVWEFA